MLKTIPNSFLLLNGMPLVHMGTMAVIVAIPSTIAIVAVPSTVADLVL